MFNLLKMQGLIAVIILVSSVAYAKPNRAIRLDEIVVTETVIRTQEETIPPGTLDAGRFINVGEMLGEIPGIGLIRRSSSATEPVIRGMGWERVATQINHLPIYGACPARMDPPIAYGHAHAVEEVVIIKGIPSVTLGPGGTGGKIILKTDYERKLNEKPGINAWLSTSYDDSRNGTLSEVGLKGGNRHVDVKATLEYLNYRDYSSADDVNVPASQEGYSASLNMAFRPNENHRWWNSLNYVREDDVDYPSLPMNLVKTDYITFNTGYRIDIKGDLLKQVDTSFGLLDVDHTMSNEGKPSRTKFWNRADTISESYAAHTKLTWRWDDWLELITGADYSYLKRDALRKRSVVATGQQFLDYIWPDVSQMNLGGFAEANIMIDDTRLLRIGGRIERVESEVNKASRMSLQQKTIQENYVRFNGSSAINTDTTDTIGSGNVLLEWAIESGTVTHIGIGISTRAAGLTERYFAFAPAPGGFQVGNPTLDPEIKYEIIAGIDKHHKWFDFSLSGYGSRVKDYILAIALAQEDVNGDGRSDFIRGFKNIDAEFYGMEADLRLKIGRNWMLPLSISTVRGKNTTNHRDLPEIPPVEGRAAIRYSKSGTMPWWLQFGGRFSAHQDNIDKLFPEDETSGFSIFHFRAGAIIKKSFHIKAGIENLFDHNYNEHLTREAIVTSGDLAAGDEIPGPGRSFFVNLKANF